MRALILAALIATLMAGPVMARQAADCAPAPEAAAQREAWRYESRGATIHGILYRPTGRSLNAGVVMLPGAAGLRQDIEAYDDVAMRLAQRGYHVLLAGYYDASRGTVDRQGQNMSLWRDAGRDGVASLKTLLDGASGRVGLWGFSLGGFLAVDSGTRDADVPALVAVAAGTDVAQPSPVRRRPSVLLLHAERDPAISVRSTRALADHLRRGGVTAETQPLPTRLHVFESHVWCEVARRSADFFDQHLVADAG